MRYRGLLYRALDPAYADEPLSGEGARRFGGRFNAKGTPALYTSLSPRTALRESARAGTSRATVLIAYETDMERVFDARSSRAIRSLGSSREELGAADWRERMQDGSLAPTQRFARRLGDDGFAGLLVRSVAPGAGEHDTNLVLFDWSDAPPTRLRVLDGGRPRRPLPAPAFRRDARTRPTPGCFPGSVPVRTLSRARSWESP